ncbi:MAG: LVIVD repeat-containing protein [Candidatus Thorarchaeota archaeon]
MRKEKKQRMVLSIVIMGIISLGIIVQPVAASVIYVDPVPDPVGPWAVDVWVSNNYAYVAHGDTGVVIVDVTDPTNPGTPVIAGVSGSAQDVHIAGSYLYVFSAWGDTWLTIMDLTNPINPVQLSFRNTGGSANGFHVDGDWVFAATGWLGLGVMNIADPTNPGFPTFTPTYSWAWNVFVSGNYAFVAEKYPGGLTIFDISDPTSPLLLSHVDTVDAWGVYVYDNYAFIATEGAGLAIVDVQDPTQPGEPMYVHLGGYAEGVFVEEDYAFVANGGAGMAVVGISDPMNPDEPVHIDTTGRSYDVYLSGDYAFVADGASGLAIIDVSQFTQVPVVEATIDFDPDTLYLQSIGQWVTVYIELAPEQAYSVYDIDIGSIYLNGMVLAESWPFEIGDYDFDGIPDLAIKFDRNAVQSILEAGEGVEISITGAFSDGTLFEGYDVIRVF